MKNNNKAIGKDGRQRGEEEEKFHMYQQQS